MKSVNVTIAELANNPAPGYSTYIVSLHVNGTVRVVAYAATALEASEVAARLQEKAGR